MTDSAYDARLRANGRAVMLSNHIMGEVVGSYSDAEKAAIMRMLEEEHAFRERNRKRRLLKRAGFPTPKTFANYDWTQARLSREEIVTCAFARNARNLALYGPVGTGKTHMCMAIGTAACEMGMPVRYFTTTELVMLLSRSKEDGSLAKLFRQLARADILFLDEFGYVPVDRDEARLLFQVISEAYDIGGLRAPVAGDHHQPRLLEAGHRPHRRPDGRRDHRPGGPPRPPRGLRGRVLPPAPHAHEAGRGWAAMTVAELAEYLSQFGEREEVMLEVRFPDLDFEVGDWAFSCPEESDCPTLVTSVHGSCFDFPDMVARLKALVDRAAYYNFVD